MKDGVMVCYRCDKPRYRQDMVGEICLECRERATDKKSVPLHTLTALLFRRPKQVKRSNHGQRQA